MMVDAAGNFTYDFTLKGTTKAADAKALQIAVANGYTAQVGDSIDNRGVPYYMAQLNERERQILSLRYGIFGQKETTQREIAQKLGISRSYVSRIEKNALSKLRSCFREKGKTGIRESR